MAKPSKVTEHEPVSVEIPGSIQSSAHKDEPTPPDSAPANIASSDDPVTPAPDERVLVRFTGPWKNYSRGDVTRLPDAEARSVIAKGLAVQQDE
jgi:hypothetical protein